MSVLRVALAQVTSTMDRLENAVRGAAGQGARLVAFPELCTTPYFCVDRAAGGVFERVPDGPTTRRLRAVADELAVVLVVPLAEQDASGGQYNSAIVIDADGTVAGTYRKRHLPHGPGSWEQDYFQSGDGPAVFTTAVGRLGVAICWDRYFPDTWQALGQGRAEVTVVPIASTVAPHSRRATLVQPAVAFLHGMFVATVNRADAGYSGGSYVATPSGEVLGGFGTGQEELVLRDLEEGC